MSDDTDTETDGNRPQISADDMARPDAIAQQIDANLGLDSEGESESSGAFDMGDGLDMGADFAGSDMTLGEMYCRILVLFANRIAENYGEGDPLFQTADGDLDLTLVRQLRLDDYVNQYLAQHGGPESLSPGTGIVVMTTIFAGFVILSDKELMAAGLEQFNRKPSFGSSDTADSTEAEPTENE